MPIKRETHKDITIDEIKYRIAKFDPLTGGYILFKLLTGVIAPILPMIKLPTWLQDFIISKTKGSSTKLDKDEFIDLEKDLLSIVRYEETIEEKSIFVPIMRPDGTFNVDELNDDLSTVLVLMGHVITFNSSGFFGEAITENIPDLMKGQNM
jgi:hypothetical protein